MISIYPANKSNYYYIKSISTKVFYFYICVNLSFSLYCSHKIKSAATKVTAQKTQAPIVAKPIQYKGIPAHLYIEDY